jgi:hypothetical protein
MHTLFRNIHNNDWIEIKEEGLLSRYEMCGILFQRNVGVNHKQSETFKRWKTIKQERLESKRNRYVIEEQILQYTTHQ